MSVVRKTVFWLHLGIGLAAGVIILLMCVTGLLLSFERQLTGFADGFKITVPPGAVPLGPEALLGKLESAPSGVGFGRDPSSPVFYQYGKEKTHFANPYTGESLGGGNSVVPGFFKWVLSWHRFLGREGASQPVGKAIIGIGNLMFLFLLVSGIILWFPRRWTRSGVQTVMLIRTRLKGRARDWNRHNAFGFWAAVPLLVIVGCGAVISQPWANDLVFRLSGKIRRRAQSGRNPAP